jgi:fumarate hydratase class I
LQSEQHLWKRRGNEQGEQNPKSHWREKSFSGAVAAGRLHAQIKTSGGSKCKERGQLVRVFIRLSSTRGRAVRAPKTVGAIDAFAVKSYAVGGFMSQLRDSLVELIRRTSVEIPGDVHQAILASLENEKKNSLASNAFKIIDQNIALAKTKSQPICQDTGSILFYLDCPVGFDQIAFVETAREAVKLATKNGYLRQNSVDSLTGKNDGTNCGPGAPAFHFHQHRSPEISVRLVLKGGGCENVGAQYSLPNEKLNANRDLDGCRKAILDAVLQAQGKGCGPGILGVCIGGDRATGYEMSKTQFLRLIPDRNPNPELDALEQDVLKTANELGIGPMGFGGKTTLLGVKICAANRLPASYFVSISYMCWAYRRQGVTLDAAGKIGEWLY